MSGRPEPPPPGVLFVGGGRMAQAMLAGFRNANLPPPVVIDPALPTLDHAIVVGDAGAVPAGFVPALTVLAVKPQVAAAAIAALPPSLACAPALSIMAGRRLDWLRAALPRAGPIVRAMPNTPGAIGRGITVAVAEPVAQPGPRPGPDPHPLVATVLSALGQLAWVTDEALIDPVTAISGGGPAYVFLLTELLHRAALDHGIPEPLAGQLARQTVAGSGALLDASPEPPDLLRRNVTSPGGTTERAIAVLAADWPDTIRRAIDAATARAREL